MGGLFSKPKMPDPPKPNRMPVETDPAIKAAGERVTADAMRRKGRLSTILTDQTMSTSGGSGTKLGA